jgi:membrane protein
MCPLWACARRSLEASRILESLDRWQRRHPVVAFCVAVVRKFLDDRAANLAALIAYYAFFSVFPLLLALVSVLGFVLEDDPALREDVVDSTLAQLPVLGTQVAGAAEPLTGSGIALAVGVAGALWAGLGVTVALGRAFEVIWDVPRLEQRSGLAERVRGLAIVGVLAVVLGAATAVTALSVGGGTVLGFTVDAAVLLAVFWLYTARPLRVRDLLPGVALAAIGVVALQSIAGWYFDHAVERADDTYGTFALVIGLLSWFLLLAQLLLLAAEVNVVLRRRLWPRALTGELGDGDRRALRLAAEAARRHHDEEITVRYDDEI